MICDPTNGDRGLSVRRRPGHDLTDGVTTAHALQTISVPDVHVYKPSLQPNLTDSPEGDMVSGHFCYTSDPHPSEDASYELQDIVCNDQQRGTGAYARNDFNPGAGASTPNAFLVRLRRSNEYQGLENQTDPDVASSGPSLPLTFGKGTTIHGDDPSVGLFGSPRRSDGSRHGDCRHAPVAAPRRAATRAAGDRAIRAHRHVRAEPDGRAGHDTGDDQSDDRCHHAHQRARRPARVWREHRRRAVHFQSCNAAWTRGLGGSSNGGRAGADCGERHAVSAGAADDRHTVCRCVLADEHGAEPDHRVCSRQPDTPGGMPGSRPWRRAAPIHGDHRSRGIGRRPVERDGDSVGRLSGRRSAGARRRAAGQESRTQRTSQLRPGVRTGVGPVTPQSCALDPRRDGDKNLRVLVVGGDSVARRGVPKRALPHPGSQGDRLLRRHLPRGDRRSRARRQPNLDPHRDRPRRGRDRHAVEGSSGAGAGGGDCRRLQCPTASSRGSRKAPRSSSCCARRCATFSAGRCRRPSSAQ